MFNDTSRYQDDIFTSKNPEFEKHIFDIYPTELQLSKASTLDKENSFLYLNIKVIDCDVYTSEFGFPIINIPLLSCDEPNLLSYGVYISK